MVGGNVRWSEKFSGAEGKRMKGNLWGVSIEGSRQMGRGREGGPLFQDRLSLSRTVSTRFRVSGGRSPQKGGILLLLGGRHDGG